VDVIANSGRGLYIPFRCIGNELILVEIKWKMMSGLDRHCPGNSSVFKKNLRVELDHAVVSQRNVRCASCPPGEFKTERMSFSASGAIELLQCVANQSIRCSANIKISLALNNRHCQDILEQPL
jgi:hypothetical protein